MSQTTESKYGNILILGVSGMLGSALFKILSQLNYNVYGTVRSLQDNSFFKKSELERIVQDIDVLNFDDLIALFNQIKPKIVINCIGVIKQQFASKDPLAVLPINALLPHRLSHLCSLVNSRLILISTDCVFDGLKGNYVESDKPNADDLYGKSKILGEIADEKHVFTIRTSIIGHELYSKRSLIDWFLNSMDSVNGFKNAIFSGLPTCELANVIGNLIIPNQQLFGLYHVSVDPISKNDLLNLTKEIYKKEIKIIPSSDIRIDRSLNSDKFRFETGYKPPDWKELIENLYQYKTEFLRN